MQAETDYPRECCGMILGPQARPNIYSRLKPCRNAQDDYHAADPENFPRTSKTAYFMDPAELFQIQKEARSFNEVIRVIYHSHIDAPPDFSKEDERMAVSDGVPVYPGADYLISSIKAKKWDSMGLYRWSAAQKKFQKV